jgi:hypothetical protein
MTERLTKSDIMRNGEERVLTRDERIEKYYHHGARELAEWLVDLEDRVKEFERLTNNLSMANVALLNAQQELDPSRLESALRMYIAELDYDIHKAIQCGEEDGLDHYPEEVDFFLRCWEVAGDEYA